MRPTRSFSVQRHCCSSTRDSATPSRSPSGRPDHGVWSLSAPRPWHRSPRAWKWDPGRWSRQATFLPRSSTHKRARSLARTPSSFASAWGSTPRRPTAPSRFTTKIKAIPGDAGAAGGVVSVLARPRLSTTARWGRLLDPWSRTGTRAAVASGLTLVRVGPPPPSRLALLKTLGFTERQAAAAIVWQSSIAVVIGMIIGVPVGVITGRSLWVLFADEINAVPAPIVPSALIAVMVVGALVLANIVAAVPGRIAARTPTSLLLRAEMTQQPSRCSSVAAWRTQKCTGRNRANNCL